MWKHRSVTYAPTWWHLTEIISHLITTFALLINYSTIDMSNVHVLSQFSHDTPLFCWLHAFTVCLSKSGRTSHLKPCPGENESHFVHHETEVVCVLVAKWNSTGVAMVVRNTSVSQTSLYLITWRIQPGKTEPRKILMDAFKSRKIVYFIAKCINH